MRAFVAVRSRYAEDQLASAVARGVRQYVVLGAGLDTYAYRSSPGIRVFEVDHAATQDWKRWRLDAAGIPIPDSMTFVPVDFEGQSLSNELGQAGFDATQPAFFSWLGVIVYLTLEAASETLRFIAGLPADSGISFDYALGSSSLSPERLAVRDALAARVARVGEPFRLFFDPPDLARLLHGIGFHRLEDLTPEEINARYFSGRGDGLSIGRGAAHLMSAWV